MKKFTLALIFTFLLTLASASAAYQYSTIWTANGQPVNGVRSLTLSCQNANCDNPFGSTVQDITSANNQVTTIYPTPSPTYGYATYWSAACYLYQELHYKPSGSGSTTANLQFTKQNDCRSDILNVQVPSSVPFGSSVSITAQIKSALTEFNHLPAGEPSDPNFVDSFLSD